MQATEIWPKPGLDVQPVTVTVGTCANDSMLPL